MILNIFDVPLYRHGEFNTLDILMDTMPNYIGMDLNIHEIYSTYKGMCGGILTANKVPQLLKIQHCISNKNSTDLIASNYVVEILYVLYNKYYFPYAARFIGETPDGTLSKNWFNIKFYSHIVYEKLLNIENRYSTRYMLYNEFPIENTTNRINTVYINDIEKTWVSLASLNNEYFDVKTLNYHTYRPIKDSPDFNLNSAISIEEIANLKIPQHLFCDLNELLCRVYSYYEIETKKILLKGLDNLTISPQYVQRCYRKPSAIFYNHVSLNVLIDELIYVNASDIDSVYSCVMTYANSKIIKTDINFTDIILYHDPYKLLNCRNDYLSSVVNDVAENTFSLDLINIRRALLMWVTSVKVRTEIIKSLKLASVDDGIVSVDLRFILSSHETLYIVVLYKDIKLMFYTCRAALLLIPATVDADVST